MKTKRKKVIIISLFVVIGWSFFIQFLCLFGPVPRQYAYVTPDLGQVEFRDKLEEIALIDTSLLYQPNYIKENYLNSYYTYTSLCYSGYQGNYILSSFLYLKDINCFLKIEGRKAYGKNIVIIKQVADLDLFPDVNDYCEGYHFYQLSDSFHGPKPSQARMKAIQKSFENNVLSKVGSYHRDIQDYVVGTISGFAEKNFKTIILVDVFIVILLLFLLRKNPTITTT